MDINKCEENMYVSIYGYIHDTIFTRQAIEPNRILYQINLCELNDEHIILYTNNMIQCMYFGYNIHMLYYY